MDDHRTSFCCSSPLWGSWLESLVPRLYNPSCQQVVQQDYNKSQTCKHPTNDFRDLASNVHWNPDIHCQYRVKLGSHGVGCRKGTASSRSAPSACCAAFLIWVPWITKTVFANSGVFSHPCQFSVLVEAFSNLLLYPNSSKCKCTACTDVSESACIRHYVAFSSVYEHEFYGHLSDPHPPNLGLRTQEALGTTVRSQAVKGHRYKRKMSCACGLWWPKAQRSDFLKNWAWGHARWANKGQIWDRYIDTLTDSWQWLVDAPFKQVSPSPFSVGCQYNSV